MAAIGVELYPAELHPDLHPARFIPEVVFYYPHSRDSRSYLNETSYAFPHRYTSHNPNLRT